jgi:hypothetical protein
VDLKAFGIQNEVFRRKALPEGHILKAPALHTSHMVVGMGISVEPLLRSGGFQLLDDPFGGKDVKVPIDGAQADARQVFSHSGIDFIRAGMGRTFLHFL